MAALTQASTIAYTSGSLASVASISSRSTATPQTKLFFHPSIKSLLYKPGEHHLENYTPFFVPVLLHAVLAVVISRYH